MTTTATNTNAMEAHWYQRAMKAEAELKRLQYRHGACPQCGGPMGDLDVGMDRCARCDWPELNEKP